MENDILNRFEAINIHKHGGNLSPHKPLLLLHALALLKNEQVECLTFRDTEKFVKPLIKTHVSNLSQSARVEYPYTRLANDRDHGQFWWVDEHVKNASGDISRVEAYERNLKAGFTNDVLHAFRENPELIDRVAFKLLEDNFSPSLHRDILDSVGLYQFQDKLEAVYRMKRDSKFRKIVLTAYSERCAICKYDIKMNGVTLALEAAHIKMHAAGGPDKVTNGLALCVIHHKLFDLGIMTVDEDMKIHVIESVEGDFGKKLNDEFHDKSISLPRRDKMAPASQYIRWHNERIFKGDLTCTTELGIS